MRSVEGAVLRLHEITTRPHKTAGVAARLRGAWPDADIFALWGPQIGGGMNTLTALTIGEAPPASPADPDIALHRQRLLDPLARGGTKAPIQGICTTRWFILPQDNVSELVRLSAEAWTTFEDDSPAQVLGLWHSRESAQDGIAEVLLSTHYPSLTVWEATRYWKPDAPGADAQRRRDAWSDLFRRRRALLLDTWVTVHGPPPM